MTTTSVSVDVTCPPWCSETPQSHLEELDEVEACIHFSAATVIRDETRGPGRNVCEEPRPANPVQLYLSSATRLDGREKESPCFHLGDAVLSVPQALATAMAIIEQIEVYRAAGGRA